ncbi:hypothetical protein SH139x_004820 [Planctomycetaceae bacterium SH139]
MKTNIHQTAATSILRKQISRLLIVSLIGFPGLALTAGCDRDVAEIETQGGVVEIEEDPLTGDRELEVED